MFSLVAVSTIFAARGASFAYCALRLQKKVWAQECDIIFGVWGYENTGHSREGASQQENYKLNPLTRFPLKGFGSCPK
jgi:hypothetical protein